MSENFYHINFDKNTCNKWGYKTLKYGSASLMFDRLSVKYSNLLMHGLRPSGLINGCVAVRCQNTDSFVISKRAKHSLWQSVCVDSIDHKSKTVYMEDENKASLNAPLIDWIFKKAPWAYAVIHWHGKPEANVTYSMLPYYDPGSVQDSQRKFEFRNFCIVNHGFFKILSKEECKAILK
jgi:hypothetical protein